MTFSDLPEICKPFVAAIVLQREETGAVFPSGFLDLYRPDLILSVHRAFARHVMSLSQGDSAGAAAHLEEVERAGLLDVAGQALVYLIAQMKVAKVIEAASKPPAAPLH